MMQLLYNKDKWQNNKVLNLKTSKFVRPQIIFTDLIVDFNYLTVLLINIA